MRLNGQTYYMNEKRESRGIVSIYPFVLSLM